VSVEPRQAASLILLRDAAGGAEVLLVQRNPEQRFMGGAWVFPGGAFHDGEDRDHAAAAVRELEEEAGIELPEHTELVPFSRWITPEGELVNIRFDTWFFAARAPGGAEATPDGGECVDARWITPSGALEAHAHACRGPGAPDRARAAKGRHARRRPAHHPARRAGLRRRLSHACAPGTARSLANGAATGAAVPC
jgi:8-oxo-dGTP pyrophosphatase MutT (NUDIX family)